jgi:hypothetical protein
LSIRNKCHPNKSAKFELGSTFGSATKEEDQSWWPPGIDEGIYVETCEITGSLYCPKIHISLILHMSLLGPKIIIFSRFLPH